MRIPKRLLPCLVLVTLAAGCQEPFEERSIDGTLGVDGYALFAVENDRQQRNDVAVTVSDADPGATYVLLYSERAPRNVGWFLFDPRSVERCGGDTGRHCEVPGYGYMVDALTVPEGATEITLRDERCGCDADRNSGWTGHWAVMRVERSRRVNPVHIDVRTIKIRGYATEPDVEQLQ